MKKIRVLVCDDSIFMRRILTDYINSQEDMEVAGVAINGVEVLPKVMELKPDVVTLDIEMPGKNGLVALKEVMANHPTPCVMCSTLTEAGAEATMIAMELGASDFVAKPKAITSETMSNALADLGRKVRTAANVKLRQVSRKPQTVKSVPTSGDQVILVASSTGGPKSLFTLFESLPKNMTAPMIIAQHIPAGFSGGLAQRLNQVGVYQVRELSSVGTLEPGVAYVGAGGGDFAFVSSTELRTVDQSDLSGFARPSANVLFASAAKHLQNRCLGVILTGMGRDGTEGGKLLHRAGSTLIGESEESCAVYGMPKSAHDAGIIEAEYPIEEMASAICARLMSKPRGGRNAAA